jgi:hypothetical protein
LIITTPGIPLPPGDDPDLVAPPPPNTDPDGVGLREYVEEIPEIIDVNKSSPAREKLGFVAAGLVPIC